MNRIALTLACGAAALAGCADIPTPRHPDAYRPGSYSEPGTAAGRSVPASRADWWRVFSDDALDRLEQMALAENADLAVADARLREAQQDLATAQASLRPSLFFTPDATRTRISRHSVAAQTAGSPVPVATSRVLENPFNTFSSPVAASYDLDVFGRLRAARDGARAASQAAEYDWQAAKLALTTTVAATWYEIAALERQSAFADEAIRAAEAEAELAREREAAGLVDAATVGAADEILADERSQAAQLRQAAAIQWHALMLLCGEQALSAFRGQPRDLPPAPRIPSGLPATMLTRRPDVAAAWKRVDAALAQIGGAKAAFYPQLSFSGEAGWQSEHLHDLFARNSLAVLAGPRLSLPLFDGGANRAALREAVAEFDEANASYRAIAFGALREVDDALSDLRELGAQAGAAERATEAAQRRRDEARDRFAEGLIPRQDLLASERAALARERQANAAQAHELIATLSLIRALGGGWTAE